MAKMVLNPQLGTIVHGMLQNQNDVWHYWINIKKNTITVECEINKKVGFYFGM